MHSVAQRKQMGWRRLNLADLLNRARRIPECRECGDGSNNQLSEFARRCRRLASILHNLVRAIGQTTCDHFG